MKNIYRVSFSCFPYLSRWSFLILNCIGVTKLKELIGEMGIINFFCFVIFDIGYTPITGVYWNCIYF